MTRDEFSHPLGKWPMKRVLRYAQEGGDRLTASSSASNRGFPRSGAQVGSTRR
jgi:hypothetical protein